jgi:site-specific DNA recombinase
MGADRTSDAEARASGPTTEVDFDTCQSGAARGKYQPLITRELWQRVQGVLDARNARKLKRGKRDFAFSSLVNCGHCGCAMVGELKKGRYVYYHCTGYKGKCGEPYVREEVIAEKFSEVLGQLNFGEEVLQWVSAALRESHADQRKEHEAAIVRLQAEIERLQNRIHAMYIDKLDGRIDRSFYVQMSEQWRVEQEKLMQEINLHQAADQCYLDEGVRLLELARSAQRLFVKQGPDEQRRMLNFVLSNSTWKRGELSITFRQPFDLISEITTSWPGGSSGGGGNPSDCPSWWGR